MLQQKQKDPSVFKVFMPLASNKNEGERSHIEYYDTYRISFDLAFPVSKEYKGTEGVIKTINNGIKESHKEIKELKLTFLGELRYLERNNGKLSLEKFNSSDIAEICKAICSQN